jgi:peptidyl-prolyl cis-trans isomerase C
MRRALASLLAVALGAVFAAPSAAADDDGTVVVKVGDSSYTVADVQLRLRALSPWQLSTMGSDAEAIKKTFAHKVLVPELLYFEEAERRKLEQEPATRDRVRDILRRALENQIREDLAKEGVSADEVKAYFEANKEKFDTPERVKLWRILVEDQAKAKKIIADVKAADTKAPELWTKLTREHSVDSATKLRDGDLGFVRPDGQTETPQLRVEPALFAAAHEVKDGEVVPEPVAEGDKWAVVWRRGSMPAVSRTLAQEENSIRQILTRKKLQSERKSLVDRLRKEHVKEVQSELVSRVTVDPMGDLQARARPGVIPRGKVKDPGKPARTERGLR